MGLKRQHWMMITAAVLVVVLLALAPRTPSGRSDKNATSARVSEIGSDRFTMDCAIYSRRHERIAAEGQSVIVCYDYGAGRKCELPASLVTAIRELEHGDPTSLRADALRL